MYKLPAISGELVVEHVGGRQENVVAETNGNYWDLADPSLSTIITDYTKKNIEECEKLGM